ncbi:Uncharacterised protein [Vibrio cholerae]|nr:Uncharacterised protein [Vibrio cholerae]
MKAARIGAICCFPMSRGAETFSVPRTSLLPVCSKFSVSRTLLRISRQA